MLSTVNQETEKDLSQLKHKRYSSDLGKQEWKHIASLITVYRTSKWPPEGIVNGILYWLKNNCLWSDLPGDFPPWQTVLYHFKKWSADGTWYKINSYLISRYGERVPYQKKKRNSCSRVVFDLSWMKSGPSTARVGSPRASGANS